MWNLIWIWKYFDVSGGWCTSWARITFWRTRKEVWVGDQFIQGQIIPCFDYQQVYSDKRAGQNNVLQTALQEEEKRERGFINPTPGKFTWYSSTKVREMNRKVTVRDTISDKIEETVNIKCRNKKTTVQLKAETTKCRNQTYNAITRVTGANCTTYIILACISPVCTLFSPTAVEGSAVAKKNVKTFKNKISQEGYWTSVTSLSPPHRTIRVPTRSHLCVLFYIHYFCSCVNMTGHLLHRESDVDFSVL